MEDKIKILKVKCPRCGILVNWHGNPDRPFCSGKCRLIDLGCWADEEYRIAGDQVPPSDQEDSE